MSTLTLCLKRVGAKLDPADKDAILARARDNRAAGMGATEAATKAARDLMAELRDELKAMEPPKPAPAPKATTHPNTVMGSRLLAIVSQRLGGLDPTWIAEFSVRTETKRMGKDGRPIVQWRNPPIPGIGRLFRKGGTQDLQALAETLEEAGYMAPGTTEREGKDAGEQAKELVRRALQRDPTPTIDQQMADLEAEMARRNAGDPEDQRDLEPDAEPTEEAAYYPALDPESVAELEAERAAIMAEAEMSRQQMESMDDADLWDGQGHSDTAATMRALGFSEQEIADELAREAAAQGGAQEGAAETGQAAAGQAGPAAADRGAAPGGGAAQEGLTLDAQTPEDLQAKSDREKAAADADRQEQRRLAEKAKADAERDEFVLTGSDRPADLAAAAGQGGLFDGPSATADAQPAAPSAASGAARRTSPRSTVQFTKPIVGPSGARLLSYTWQWKPMEFVDARGEERVKRISDWDASESSGDTGRDVVHQFVVDDNGTEKTVSAESALKLLGFTTGSDGKASFTSLSSAAKTLARLRMQQAELEQAQQAFETDMRAVEAMPLPPVELRQRTYSSGKTAWEWVMGDADVSAAFSGEPKPTGPIPAERLDTLTRSWRDNRAMEVGGWSGAQFNRESFAAKLSGLADRIQKQQAKVDKIVAHAAGAESAAPPIADQVQAVPPAQPEQPTENAPEESAAQEEEAAQRIADFGEKIGGARKDTARPTGPRMAREQDDRPTWARKYMVAERTGRDGTKTGKWGVFTVKDGMMSPATRQEFATEQAALDAIPLIEVSRRHRVYAYKDGDKMLYGIYRRLGERKRALVKGGFATEAAAMTELATNPAPVIEHKFEFPERPWLDNIERIGPVRRTGNVTPKMFEDTFGFRGGEFGKWNEGGDGQETLNHAYDGLMDLADALGIPPRALSLNGELAIAFGSRGKGGKNAAAAHYERDYGVINLTKMQGAGSLAHEFFHALDHYLGRQDGKASSVKKPNERGDMVYQTGARGDRSQDYVTYGFGRKSNVREELRKAFEGVMAAIRGKPRQVPVDPKPLEKHLERERQSLEYYLRDLRGSLTDGIYNRSKKTATAEQLKQWDALAQKLMTGDVGADQYIGPNGPIAPDAPAARMGRLSAARLSAANIVAANAIYKAVTGRSFDKTGYDSRGNQILQAARSIRESTEALGRDTERAARGETYTQTITTDYYSNARNIDGNRASPYWSTMHEMGARAFESFILDRIAEREGRSDYLVYGAENWHYTLYDMKPYPEGDERKAINAAFSRLFDVIKSRETTDGRVELYEPDAPAYSGAYDTDLFGNPVLAPARNARAARPAGTGVRGDVQPEPGLQDTQAPAGEYFARTTVGRETQRTLGAKRITSAADAAAATRYLYRSAVERFDGIVTDKDGKPLAVVGGFKGALAQALVYPATIVAEAVRVPGAARIWFSHNHPSGRAELSRADEFLNRSLADVFRGSGIEPMGTLAVAGDQFAFVAADGDYFGRTDDIPKSTGAVTVPVVERELADGSQKGMAIESPQQAKDVASLFYGRANVPGLVLLDSQHRVSAWVPLPQSAFGKLRDTGGLSAIYRAVSEANAGSAILVHGGELDGAPLVGGMVGAAQNIGAALKKIDVNPLDVINAKTGISYAEQGRLMAAGPVLSRATTAATGIPFADLDRMVSQAADQMPGLRHRPVAVASASDLPAPIVEALRRMNAMGTTRGLRMPDGRIYLIADKLDNMQEAQAVLFHEVYGHEGLRAFLGDRYVTQMALLRMANPKLAAEANRWYADYGASQIKARVERGMTRPQAEAQVRALAVEEALADRAGDNQPPKAWKALIAKLQQALRGMGLDWIADRLEAMTEAETFAVLMGARRAIQRGQDVPAWLQPGDQPAASNQAAPFYSALLAEVNKADMKQGTAGAWSMYLNALAKKGAVKADEIEWTGLREWLAMQSGKVTKAAVGEYLAGNGVVVTETQSPPGKSIGTQDFSGWQLPGGTNYREVLLTLPSEKDALVKPLADATRAWREAVEQYGLDSPEARAAQSERARIDMQRDDARPDYRSGHWYQPNILAHIRLNDRTDADGKRVLFVEEIQSDWGQEGKKRGFSSAKPEIVESDTPYGKTFNVFVGGRSIGAWGSRERAEEMAATAGSRGDGGVPSAPFIDTTDKWVALAIKRVISIAAREGYDRVAFVTGEQSANRYDLSKQIQTVRLTADSKDGALKNAIFSAIQISDGRAINRIINSEKELEDVIGKDLAAKLMSTTPTKGKGGSDGWWVREISGLDLKVGGEGMRAFYDRIVPAVLKDVLRKVGGGQMGVVQIGAQREISTNVDDGAGGVIKRRESTGITLQQPGFDITPAMREKAAAGLPLFDRRPAVESRQTEEGRPTFKGNGLVLDFPLPTERVEIIPTPGQEVLNYPIMPADSFESLGFVELLVEGGKVKALLDIYVNPEARGGVGRKVIETLLAADPQASIEISNIVESARGFWAGMGIPEQNRAAGEAYDGTLNWQTYAQAQAQNRRGARGNGQEGGQARGRPDAGAAGRVQETLGKDGQPALSQRPDQTQTPEFKRWFGGSKVVDANGEPLVVYHGTDKDFSAFDPNRIGDNFGVDEDGFFFTNSKVRASGYADPESEFAAAGMGARRGVEPRSGSNVMPVYLSLQSPLTLDAYTDAFYTSPAVEIDEQGISLTDYFDDNRRSVVEFAKRGGHDGVLFQHKGKTLAIAFRPEQIKSAIGNRGTFDPADANITLSQRPAANAAPTTLTQAEIPATGRAVATTATGLPTGWRDPTNRLQFAPGAWLYEAIGRLARPLLVRANFAAATPELRRQLRQMKLDVQKAQDVAAAVAKEAGTLTEAERLMVSDIIEKELAAGIAPPEHAVRLAALMQQAMTAQSKELVRLGMLSDEAAQRWEGAYLPRFYETKLRKEVKDAWADAVKRLVGRTSAMKGVKGDHLKGRGMYETIPETDLAKYLAMGWEVRDPEYQPGLPAMDGVVQVWRDYTRAEREKMGEIRDAGFRFVMGYMQTQRDIALGRLFEKMANDPASSSRLPREGWVRVPDTTVEGTGAKRYGKLAGRYVPQETLSHLSQIEESQSAAWQMYRKAMGYWKMGKTAMNPVSHVNNILSNLTMAHFAGVSYHRGDKYLAAIKDFATGAPAVKEARDAGLFLGTLSDAELMDALPPELRDLAAKADSQAIRGAKFVYDAMSFFLRKPMGAAYQTEDLFFRYLLYKDARGRGASPDDAIDWAQRFIFTYDDLPKNARFVRDFGIPFFAYTYKAVPALLHTALTHPARFAAPAAVMWGANAIAYAIAMGDEDDDWWTTLQRYLNDEEFRQKVKDAEQLEREVLPPWMKGSTAMATPKAIRLGMDELTKLPVFIDVARIVPGGDLFDVSPNAGGLPIPQPLTPSHPLLNVAVAMIGNKDLWTGKDLVDKNDTSAEAAEKRGEWIWKQLTPAVAVGNYHWERTLNALAQASGGEIRWLPEFIAEDYTGVGRDGLPVQPKYTAMQTFGIKARPLDLEKSREIAESQQKRLIRDIDAEIRQLKRLQDAGTISDRVFERKIDEASVKKERLREGLTVDGEQR